MAVIIRLVVILFVCWAFPAFGGTHWVSPSGSADWAKCVGTSDPAVYCALTGYYGANGQAAAGDTVYLKGGTYSYDSAGGEAIYPNYSGSGSGTGRIIYSNAPGEAPIVQQANTTNTATGIHIVGKSWIKITGIAFKNFQSGMFVLVQGASYNEISYCSFTNDSGYEPGQWASIGGYDGLSGWSTNNWIHHNYFSKEKNANPCGEATDLFRIGNAENPLYSADNYNTVENNYLEYGGHSTLYTTSKYNVVKNNIAHNEPWIAGCVGSANEAIYVNSAYNGLYGHRNFAIGDGDTTHKNYILVEGNRVGHAGVNPGNGGSTNVDISSPGNIVRYNFIYNGIGGSGIYMKWANATTYTGGVDNRVYNNTIYHNGYGWDWNTYGHMNVSYNGRGIAQYNAGSGPTLNVIKNNIVYDSGKGDICALGLDVPCSPQNYDTVTNNWLTANGDPHFSNPDVTAPMSQNLFPSAHGYASVALPDLSLTSSSVGVIDRGTYLTTTTGSGSSSTSLAVADAAYFQDGSWGSYLARGVTLFPDWIAIGTVTNVVQISSINYNTNTITLASPMTWANNAPIWLYKKSDGTQVLYGSAPDYGAYEYGGTGPSGLAAPTNVRVAP